jgi:hypothetical protein
MERILSSKRPDYIFSYWILIWFFLYIAKVVPYNPLYLFFAGISLAVIQTGIMVAYAKSFAYISSFLLASMLIKGVPIYFLWDTKTTQTDILAMFLSVVVFICWLKINRVSIRRFISEYLTPDENGRISFPVSNVIYQIIFTKV